MPLALSFRIKPEGVRETKRDWKRKNSDTAEGIRLPCARSVHHGDRGHCETDRGANCRADSIAHDEEQVLRAAFAARGQEIAGAVRDPDAQASAGYSRPHAADGGCADEARSAGGCGCGD